MPAESELEARVRKYATSQGCLYWKFTSPGTDGVPDRIVVSPSGVTGYLELKAPGQKPTARQRYWLSILEKRHVWASWTDDYDEAITFIQLLNML